MDGKLYKNFQLLQFFSIFSQFICFIKYDKVNMKFYEVNPLEKYIKCSLLALMYCLLLMDTGNYLLIRNVMHLTKMDLINLVTLPIIALVSLQYFCFIYSEQKLIINIIDDIKILEDILTEQYDYSKTKRFVNYGCKFICIAFRYIDIFILPTIYTYITRPNTKMFCLTYMQAYITYGFASYLIISVILTTDRTNILNEILDRFSNVNFTNQKCYRCTDQRLKPSLCKKHQVE